MICYEFYKNLNLFCEFDADSSGCVYSRVEVDGQMPKHIKKNILLKLIKDLFEEKTNTIFYGKQYMISTRSKDDSYRYYIVVSIIQNTNTTTNTN